MSTLLRGDCLQLLPSVATGSVDLICCDLPYGTTRNKWDSQIDLTLLWPELLRVAKDRAAILLFAQTPFDKVLGVSKLELLRYEWVWEKTSATGHLNAKKMPLKAHENVLVFYRRLPTYNPQMSKGHVRKTSKTGKTYSSPNYGREAQKPDYDSTERYPRSVVAYASDKQTNNVHPTQKPVALLEMLIRTYTDHGETVLDCCMGSGTTGVASVRAGRKFIGFELDAGYFDIAIGRVMEESVSVES